MLRGCRRDRAATAGSVAAAHALRRQPRPVCSAPLSSALSIELAMLMLLGRVGRGHGRRATNVTDLHCASAREGAA